MIKEYKEKWVAALRSGQYQQGRGVLRINGPTGQYCCLGVLCDVMEKEGNGRWFTGDIFAFGGDAMSGYLPVQLLRLVQLDEHLETRLAVLNDKGQSFEDIAQYIEEHA